MASIANRMNIASERKTRGDASSDQIINEVIPFLLNLADDEPILSRVLDGSDKLD